jgi:sec-independent protein translocase protein TatA
MFDGLFQPAHLLIILVICLLIFGPRRLPELGKGLGEAIKGFRDGMKDTQSPPSSSSTTPESKDQPTQK